MFDAIIAGLGAFGAATARSLARRGASVLGLDAHRPPHRDSSHHGRSRIVREACFEGPHYAPLAGEALRHWHQLEEEAGTALFRPTGALMIGPADGELVRGTLAAARTRGIAHELLGSVDLRQRHPGLEIPDAAVGVLEGGAGVLFPERCISALLESARAAGATLMTDQGVESWTADGDGVTVATAGERHRARALVLATGPWLGRLLPDDSVPPPRVERQVVHWFLPAREPDAFREGAFPVVLWEHVPGRFFYLVPDLGDGLKAALHHGGQIGDPDALRREVTDPDREAIRHLLHRFAPDAEGRLLESAVCMYSNTPDGHLLLGPHPRCRNAIVVGGGSGHGFKFATALGEAAAAMVLGEEVPFEVSALDPGRFDGR